MIKIFTDLEGNDFMTINRLKKAVNTETLVISPRPLSAVETGTINAPLKTLISLAFYLSHFAGETTAYTDMFRKECIDFYTRKKRY